jgi:hypothetical protein
VTTLTKSHEQATAAFVQYHSLVLRTDQLGFAIVIAQRVVLPRAQQTTDRGAPS